MDKIENHRTGIGRELLTAFRLAHYLREGRLIVWPEQQPPPVTVPTSTPAGVKAPTITKLAVGRMEAATLLSVSIRTFDRWVAHGLITPGGVGRRKIFAVTELERFLRETSESINM